MTPTTGKRSLEKLRIFPYVAWLLIAGFALFVYQLSTELTVVASALGEQTSALEQSLKQPSSETDFDALANPPMQGAE